MNTRSGNATTASVATRAPAADPQQIRMRVLRHYAKHTPDTQPTY